MSNTTYVVRTNSEQGFATRSSDTMAYTHAVLVTINDKPTNDGPLSWHKSEAAAQKAAQTARGLAGRHYSNIRVVPVEVHEGGKAAVERKLKMDAVHQEAKGRVSAAAAKTATKKVTAKAPAKKATTKAPAKAAKAAPAKKATAKPSGSVRKGTPVLKLDHPAGDWLSILADKGMSGAAAARQMGIAPMTLNRLLNGHGIPTANICVRFAKVADLDVEQVWNKVCAYELRLAQAAVK